MTEDAIARLMEDRARALAAIILTRRGDLTISETSQEAGLDFHVTIAREDKPMRLIFGVLIKGIPSPLTIEQADRVLGPTMGQFQGMRKFTYPVCLFFFTLREDQAFFSWLAEPALIGDAPKLVHHREPHCVQLTDELLGRVVDRIVGWYDAVEAVLIV
ncbi:DUF4365 domain-containing protein [Tautonia plasticadhaerens]|uniref:DUF4365 domain-containing protein n=1 Tax=Tautonia plasticadhaerens TaxID=2527974 RepID=A0A518GVE6_9BACT|nr:DUF4365 domain-containing protein [Tautonia plasticadhaerens]QDV32565.1 hypothetical protein ElP_03990 [Tautonia plasticadhaerens]